MAVSREQAFNILGLEEGKYENILYKDCLQASYGRETL